MEEKPEKSEENMSVDHPPMPLDDTDSDEVFIVVGEPGDREEQSGTAHSDSQEEVFMVDQIVDIKAFLKEKTVKYRVRWEGFGADDDTWERADSLAESPLVAKSIADYREANKDKVEKEEAKIKVSPARPRSRRRQTWEYVSVDEEPNRSDLTNPRELDESDEFYGEVAKNVKGEAKKLFDPDHKNSPTELLLSQTATSERLTRRQMRELLPGGLSQDSQSPTSSTTSSPAVPKTRGTSTSSRSPGRQRCVKVEPDVIASTNASELDSPPPLPTSQDRPRKKRSSIPKKDTPVVKSPLPNNPTASPSARRKRAASPNRCESRCSSSSKSDESTEVTIYKQCQEFDKMFPNIPIHKGDIDLRSIQNEYQEILKKMTKELNPQDYRFGREFIRLLSSGKKLDPYAIEILFKKLPVAQLQAIIHWKEEGSGGSILHWICANLPCDSAHVGDQITNMLCTYWKPVPGSDTKEHMVRSRDIDSNTPLHIAVEKEAVCRATVLLNNRACLHVANRMQKTPLMIAYEKNNAYMVSLLLKSGADCHNLQSWAMRQQKELRRQEALDEMVRHSEDMRKLLMGSRKKVLGPLEEVEDYYSPVRVSLFREAPVLNFQLPHKHFHLLSDDYLYMVALHVCSFDGSDASQWTARCWGGLKQDNPPFFNGHSLKNDRAQAIDHPMLYFVEPVLGDNYLEVQITPNEIHYDILACQLFLVRPVPDFHNDPPLNVCQ